LTPRLPSGPLRALMKLKYACMPRGIGAYSEAGPLSGNVPPIVIDLLVTPGVALGVVVRSGAATADDRPTSAATSAVAATKNLFTPVPSLPC
jgi:hypothetical protein